MCIPLSEVSLNFLKRPQPKMFVAQLFITIMLFATACSEHCAHSSWWDSFDEKGLSMCNERHYYIKGFKRSGAPKHWIDGLYLLEGVECCSRTTPWLNSEHITVHPDWTELLDKEEVWAKCPEGYFLQGLYRSDKCLREYANAFVPYKEVVDCKDGYLENVEDGRCSKPVGHPDEYGECYNEDISDCFDKKEATCSCKRKGYFVAGIHKGFCNNLSCLERLRCCRMADKPDSFDSIEKVKKNIMEKTLKPIANLAHILGYAWCGGCKSPYVGDDFLRHGDTWKGDNTVRCDGYRSEETLSIKYDHWRLEQKEIIYGDATDEVMPPQAVDGGVEYNKGSTPATNKYVRSIAVVNTITHTNTDSWKHSHTSGLKLNFKVKDIAGVELSYAGNYEESHSKAVAEGNSTTNTFTVDISRSLPPRSESEWKILVKKSKRIIPYTAVVVAKFSAEFQGFLRWGGGYNGPSTNYHQDYRGSGQRPTFPYAFGNKLVPFCTDLRNKSHSHAAPWLWSDIKSVYPSAQKLIDGLTNEDSYVFTKRGVLELVQGYSPEVVWGEIKGISTVAKRSKRSAEIPQSGKSVYVMKNVKDKPANVKYPEVALKAADRYDYESLHLDEIIN
ncbi:Aerolysin [Bulinus truncatus]|nr:Aerolysin [Bulinus truncatus]